MRIKDFLLICGGELTFFAGIVSSLSSHDNNVNYTNLCVALFKLRLLPILCTETVSSVQALAPDPLLPSKPAYDPMIEATYAL